MCLHDGIFHNNENKQTIARHNKSDTSYKHNVAWKKLDAKDYILWDFIYIKQAKPFYVFGSHNNQFEGLLMTKGERGRILEVLKYFVSWFDYTDLISENASYNTHSMCVSVYMLSIYLPLKKKSLSSKKYAKKRISTVPLTH